MKQVLVLASILIFTLVLSGCTATTDNQAPPQNGAATPPAAPPATPPATVDTSLVDCSTNPNPSCFLSRMAPCLPTTATMTGNGGENIVITIVGYENEKCHFQRKITAPVVSTLECYFPRGTFTGDALDQTFGNDKGLQQLVDTSCTMS